MGIETRNGRLLLISVLAVLLLALQGAQVWASPALNATDANTANEMASTVSTAHMSVYLAFPTSVYTGQTETISAMTTATSSGRIVSLSIDFFALVDGQLVKIASQTVVANEYVLAGEKWRSSIVVVIPTDAQKDALLTGTITEVWAQASNYYSPYYVTPYYSMHYYTQNSQYYNYNYYGQQQTRMSKQTPSPETVRLFNGVVAPETARLPNGVVALQTPSNGAIQLNPQLALPNGNAAFQQSPQTHMQPYVNMNVHQRSYVSHPYYVPNYATNYAPDYYAQVTSQQTFALTYILG